MDVKTFLISGDDMQTLTELAQCLKKIGLRAEARHLNSLSPESVSDNHIILIDIDGNNGLPLAYQLASETWCLIATLSDEDRPADQVMHILKPLGFIDIQIMLIRAGCMLN
jgi:hypothetical protein